MSAPCVLDQLDDLLRREAGWNGYDALPVDPLHVVSARAWFTELYYYTNRWSLPWGAPLFVGSDAEGGVSFEWFNGDKKLTVSVADDGIQYLQSWGGAKNLQFAEGDASHLPALRDVWEWLTANG